MTLRAEDARRVLDAADAGLARLAELTEVNAAIGDVASHSAEAAVALLSLMPLVSTDARALNFLGDAMHAVNESLRVLGGAQAAILALSEHEATRARTLAAVVEDGEPEIGGPGWSVKP